MKINLLSADVYNRIAAGEVVDRPYSVVKELVENAIDAGATEIAVEIERGGKALIRVRDNGSGIEKEDLPRAFLPHATSKLKEAEELFSIHTLGFRGEAVASIAAVSKMTILSKTKEGVAYSLTCDGGKMGSVEEAGGANGTEVTVADLFYNTPARLKFLKSDGQEEADVTGMMTRFVLSRPDIAFTYSAGGKVKLRSFGDGLESAMANVYGAGILANCTPISADKHGILLKGYIGNQNFSKPTRSYQSLFVNGRYVVNQTVSSAITNAYSAYLMKRQYPFYVLFLDVPAEIVDVNVHPNKADVRFADNRIIYGSVYSVLSAVLDGSSRALEYIAPDGASRAQAGEQAEQAQPAQPAQPAAAPLPYNIAEEKGAAQEQKPAQVREEGQKPPAPMSYARAKQELSFDLSPASSKNPAPAFFFPEERPAMQVRKPTEEEDVFAENKRLLQEQEAKKQQERVEVKSLSYKGELFRTYLIYECGEDANLVDQHAAHERLLYDRLVQKTAARQVAQQPMLVPFVYSANAQEFAFLKENFASLEALGFEIGEFGGTSVKISAVPVDLKNIDLNAFLGEILSSMESMRATRLADILKDKLASAACKAAVKGGERLTEGEVRALLERMDGNMGLKCPHGRPVAVHIRKAELEKLFKRIV